MKKITFMTALAAVAFTSCTQDEFETPSSNIVGSNAIVFATSQKAKAMTRSGETATTINQFTVDAVNADKSKFFTSEVFTYDQTNSVFRSSIAHYWPTTGSLSFYAINPAGTHALDANNVPYYTYSNWAGEKDLVAATVLAGDKQIPYPLTFKHLTSQIYVSAESKDKTQELTYKLVSVKLTTPSTGVYNFADATGGVGTWTIDNTKTSEYSYATSLPRSFKQNGQVELSSCYWNVLPVTDGTMTFSIEYQVLQNGKIITDNTGVNTKTCEIESPNLEAGKRYNYNFLLDIGSQEEIVFSVSIADWSEGDSTNHTPKEVTPAESDPIDIGLPSGLKWAKGNLGSTKETDEGLYYAWGETTGYAKVDGHNFTNANYTASSITANLTLEQDAAHVKLGGNWRMPTYTEFLELFQNTYCEWTDNYKSTGKSGIILYQVKDDAHKGYYLADGSWMSIGTGTYTTSSTEPEGWSESTYKLSDVHLFFPAAHYYSSSGLSSEEVGQYWTSSFPSSYGYTGYCAHFCNFSTSSISPTYYMYYYENRSYGRSVRAVHD